MHDFTIFVVFSVKDARIDEKFNIKGKKISVYMLHYTVRMILSLFINMKELFVSYIK